MPLVSKAFGDIITFTRASTGTYFDSTGTLQSAAIDVPRFDYDPATLAAQGFLIEEARTNSIRNNTMQGAVAGTPGTLPTNWSFFEASSELTSAVVATGTENGITYIDIKVSGTVTAQRSALMFFDAATAASASQSWTESLYLKVQAGSTANIEQINIRTDYYSSAPVFLASTVSSALTVTSAALNTQRQSNSVTTPASTAFIQPTLRVRSNASGAIDITLRIGLPQLEQGAFATSVIPTTTTALTRSADVASVNTLSPWFNATEGTLYTESVLARQNATADLQVATLRNAANTNQIKTLYRASGATGQLVVDTAVNQADLTATGVISANATVKMALAYAANDFAASGNGGAVVTNTSGTVPSGFDRMTLGATGLNGYLRRITYYPRRLSNAELVSITS